MPHCPVKFEAGKENRIAYKNLYWDASRCKDARWHKQGQGHKQAQEDKWVQEHNGASGCKGTRV